MKRFLLIFSSALISIIPSFAERVEHEDCYAEWSEKELTLGNALVERKWTIQNGLLTATSFKDKASGTEWLRQPGRQPAPHPGGEIAGEERELVFTTRTGKLSPVEKESLVVDLAAKGAEHSFAYRFQVFPDSSGITVRFFPEGKVAEEELSLIHI